MAVKNFKVGQRWKRRDGEIIRIREILYDGRAHSVIGSDGGARTAEGIYILDEFSPLDLMEFVPDTPSEGDNVTTVTTTVTTSVNPELRQEHIRDIIVACIKKGMPSIDITHYIELYDNSLGELE
jgi:hypothetical protein